MGIDWGQVCKRVWRMKFLVWNRVRIWRTGRYNPTKNYQEYPPPPFLGTPPLISPAKWRPRNERRKSVLHDDASLPRSGKCSWLNLFEPTRSTTQILVVACHDRGEAVTARCHGSKISGSQQAVVLQIWQEEKNDKNDMRDSCAWLHSASNW